MQAQEAGREAELLVNKGLVVVVVTMQSLSQNQGEKLETQVQQIKLGIKTVNMAYGNQRPGVVLLQSPHRLEAADALSSNTLSRLASFWKA